MTLTEWTVIIGGGALGYWLVAVMWPNLRDARPVVQPPPVPGEPPAMWHQVLGVARDADRTTIEAAYRARLDEYLPDRVAHLPPDVQALARARTHELELAYDAALRDLEWLRPR